MIGPGAPSDLDKLSRGTLDYDAEVDEVWFEYHFNGTGDQSLGVAWTIAPAPRSYDVGLHFVFCADAACTKKVEVPGSDPQQLFGYVGDTYNPWYYGETDGGYAGMQKGFDSFDQNVGLVKVSDVMCLCIDSAYATGKFLVGVQAIDVDGYVLGIPPPWA